MSIWSFTRVSIDLRLERALSKFHLLSLFTQLMKLQLSRELLLDGCLNDALMSEGIVKAKQTSHLGLIS